MSYNPTALGKSGPIITSGSPNPNWTYENTADTLATIRASGYFNPSFASSDNVAGSIRLNDIIYVIGSDGSDYVKVTSLNPIVVSTNVEDTSLANGDIFIGNASNIAAPQTMSGDATITNAGVLTIANDAITTVKILDAAVTTSKILDANVTLSKLSSGIIPTFVCRDGGQESNGGGSATIAITSTGTLTTDLAIAQVLASSNAVTVQKVTPTANTVTVILSADPGASTVITWMVFRLAA